MLLTAVRWQHLLIGTCGAQAMKIQHVCIFGKVFCREFKAFAVQGNVFDLAVGIIIGTAFSNVVKSLVEDVITPPFGFLLGGVDFANLTIKMRNFIYTDQPPVVVRYGKFIQEILYLLIMALVLFFIVKSINKLHTLATKRRLEEGGRKVKEMTDEVKLLTEIRDLLAQQLPVVEKVAV